MSGRVRSVRRCARSLAPLVAAGSLAVSGLALPGVASADTGTATYTFTGAEQTYTVPAGVNAVTVTAVGAPGGGEPGSGTTGGFGADLTATVPLPPNTTTLYVEVGGAGQASPCNGPTQPATGGFNGGGDSPDCGGGGGGASDVRTTSIVAVPDAGLTAANDSRLVTAGGGGGGGACDVVGNNGGAAGGSTTGAGAGASGCSEGGNGGFGAPGGSGGESAGFSGSPGTLGQGGDVPNSNGGAGGGGYYGGGGASAGGGGAGSSFWVTGATNTSMTEDTTGTAEITITPLFATATTTTLTSSVDPAYPGRTVTYTATVAPTDSSTFDNGGRVAFADAGSPISGCSDQPLAAGQATCQVSYSGPGSHSITATYSGDDAYAGSTTATALTETVIRHIADLAIALTAPATAADGQSITETVTVTNLGPAPASRVVTSLVEPYQLTITDAGGGHVNDHVITWRAAGLAAGDSLTYTVLARVHRDIHTSVLLRAVTVSATRDTHPANNATSQLIRLG